MILSDVKEIRRGHRGNIFMEILAIELLARHRNGSIQKAMIPHTLRAAVHVDGIGMEQ